MLIAPSQAANAAFIPWWETSAARRGEFVHRGARLVARTHRRPLAAPDRRAGQAAARVQARDPPLRAHARALRGDGQEPPRRVRAQPRQGHATGSSPSARSASSARSSRGTSRPRCSRTSSRPRSSRATRWWPSRPTRRRSRRSGSPSCCTRPGFPAASSTSSPARARWSARRWSRHPLVRKIGFTGSTPVGERVMELAAKGAKRLTLELGGSDPFIVLKDADLAGAASAASVGRFFNCGQACLAVKRVSTSRPRSPTSSPSGWSRRRGKLKVGPGTMEGVFLGPLHSERQRAEIEEQVEDARGERRGAHVGGGRPDIRDRATSTSRRSSASRPATRGSPARRSSGPCCRSGRVERPRRGDRARERLAVRARLLDLDAQPRRGFAGPPSGSRPATRGSTRRSASSTSCRSAAGARAASARSTGSRRSSTTWRRSPSSSAVRGRLNNSGTLVDRRLEAGHGDKVAIRCAGETVTYAQLHERICARRQRARGARRRPRGPRADDPRRLADLRGAVPGRDAHGRRARAGVVPGHDGELRPLRARLATRS